MLNTQILWLGKLHIKKGECLLRREKALRSTQVTSVHTKPESIAKVFPVSVLQNPRFPATD